MSIAGRRGVPIVVRNLNGGLCNLPKKYEKDVSDEPLQDLQEKDAEYDDDTLIQTHPILSVSFQSNGQNP